RLLDEICGRAEGAAGAWRRRRADRGCRGPLLVHGDRAPRSPPVVICSVERAERAAAAARRVGGYDDFRFVVFFFAGPPRVATGPPRLVPFSAEPVLRTAGG